MKIRSVIDYLNEIYPLSLQEHYDNSGFCIGDPENDLSGIVVALDLTQEVIDEAVSANANLIVTHHPLIFNPIRNITSDTLQGSLILNLITNHIALYSAHTSLDNHPSGVSFALAAKLGIRNTQILRPLPNFPDSGAGMVGDVEPVDFQSFVSFVKERLGLPFVKCSGRLAGSVSRVALCGGSGSFLIGDAIEAGADVLLTADIKYHDFQLADDRISIIDIGHFESEQWAQEIIYSDIIKKFSNFACRIVRHKTNYVSYM